MSVDYDGHISENEFITIEHDGMTTIVPSLASVNATCDELGITRMPGPCDQCARGVELQQRINKKNRAIASLRHDWLGAADSEARDRIVEDWLRDIDKVQL